MKISQATLALIFGIGWTSVLFASEVTKKDPFDPVEKIPSGVFSGKTLNTRTMRPLIALKMPEALKESFRFQAHEHKLVANFAHDRGDGLRFWIAKIPVNTPIRAAAWIKNTFDVQENLSEVDAEMLAHSQLIFHLKKPVELLVDQSKLDPSNADLEFILRQHRLEKPVRIYSVAASLEAMFRFEEGELPFFDKDLWVVRDAIPSVVRILSWSTRRAEIVAQKGGELGYQKSVVNYPLDYDHFPIERIFEATIGDSLGSGFKRFYNLLSDSCTTRSYHWIDSTLSRPEADHYYHYFSDRAQLLTLIGEMRDALQFQKDFFGEIKDPTLRQLLTGILEHTPERILEQLERHPNKETLLRSLLTHEVLTSLPSAIRENLELRAKKSESSRP